MDLALLVDCDTFARDQSEALVHRSDDVAFECDITQRVTRCNSNLKGSIISFGHAGSSTIECLHLDWLTSHTMERRFGSKKFSNHCASMACPDAWPQDIDHLDDDLLEFLSQRLTK
jgi:hypothetical protein